MPLGPATCARCGKGFERTHQFQVNCPDCKTSRPKAKSGRGPGRPPKAKADTPPTGAPTVSGELRLIRDNLNGLYVQAGLLVSLAKPASGRVIVESAQSCSDAWVDLARTNPAVRRALVNMTRVSAVGAVVAAHVPIVMAVAADTGLLVPTPAGVPGPIGATVNNGSAG